VCTRTADDARLTLAKWILRSVRRRGTGLLVEDEVRQTTPRVGGVIQPCAGLHVESMPFAAERRGSKASRTSIAPTTMVADVIVQRCRVALGMNEV
jgi:hypothetical protein